MHGGDPEVDRVAEPSWRTIAKALIEKSISTDMSASVEESAFSVEERSQRTLDGSR
jgi:hypothetical protein